MKILETRLAGVLIIEPVVFSDVRGFLQEAFHRNRYGGCGIPDFVQDNYCRSVRGVIRGLHFQMQRPQGKLIYVSSGEVFDVVVDIRSGSPTYAQWVAVHLSGDNHRQLYIPAGFAHGFCVVSDAADVHYKFTEYYDPRDEGGVIWNDRDLKIEWPVESPMLSPRDAAHPTLAAIPAVRLPAFRH